MKKITIQLSEASINQAIKELNAYKRDLALFSSQFITQSGARGQASGYIRRQT
jgi:hypothetical protein